MSKGWAPKTKGSYLIYPCKQVAEAKNKTKQNKNRKQGLTHIWLCAIPWLLHPSAMWPSSRLDSLGFISLLCHPFFPASLSEHRPVCFFSGPPPFYTPVTCLYLYHLISVGSGALWAGSHWDGLQDGVRFALRLLRQRSFGSTARGAGGDTAGC
jgi:hypothetical protein